MLAGDVALLVVGGKGQPGAGSGRPEARMRSAVPLPRGRRGITAQTLQA